MTLSLVCCLAALAASAFADDRGTTRASVASNGAQGNQDSLNASISADGRFVAFHSAASNLVPGDTNRVYDVFVHDRLTGATTRVSVATDGSQGDDSSFDASISADGRFVAFTSDAATLVAGNGGRNIFVHDRLTGATRLASVSSSGWASNGESTTPSISADGRFVAFTSDATNLTPGDGGGGSRVAVFVRDLLSGTTTKASLPSDGAPPASLAGGSDPSISAHGRYVAFVSYGPLVPGDTNAVPDVYVRDRGAATTTRVSLTSTGGQGDDVSVYPAISAHGRYVAFHSVASNLVAGDGNDRADVFVHDRRTGSTRRVSVASDGSEGDGSSVSASISADGRLVAFESSAQNLVARDTNLDADVFVRDRQAGTTTRVNVADDGGQAITPSPSTLADPSISADGRFVAFDSFAPNLVPGDINGSYDIFVRTGFADLVAPRTTVTGVRIREAKRRATFRFTSSELRSTFRCKLDRRPFRRCSSPRTYRKLTRGMHSFRVRAVDEAHNADPTPAVRKFKIKR